MEPIEPCASPMAPDEPVDHFLELPDEMVLNIFQKLSAIDLFRGKQVSSRFEEISNDRLLWKSIYMTRFSTKVSENTDFQRHNISFEKLILGKNNPSFYTTLDDQGRALITPLDDEFTLFVSHLKDSYAICDHQMKCVSEGKFDNPGSKVVNYGVSPDHLVVGRDDQLVEMFMINEGKLKSKWTLRAPFPLSSIHFEGDEVLLLGTKGEVRALHKDLRKVEKETRLLQRERAYFHCVTKEYYVLSQNEMIVLLNKDLSSEKNLLISEFFPKNTSKWEIHSQGDHLVIFCQVNQKVAVWNTNSLQPDIFQVSAPDSTITAVRVYEYLGKNYVMIGTDDGSLTMYSLNDQASMCLNRHEERERYYQFNSQECLCPFLPWNTTDGGRHLPCGDIYRFWPEEIFQVDKYVLVVYSDASLRLFNLEKNKSIKWFLLPNQIRMQLFKKIYSVKMLGGDRLIFTTMTGHRISYHFDIPQEDTPPPSKRRKV